ncbi:hypothetical protein A3B51_02230 [Candidatus Curtissbacteria bacterium RIFCSPLOWO2_01_FULL_41_18]|uniref:Bacterial Ig-like domain-containing protein n=2 Tax=Candidatus Curtissiibacteriota TaxID=1752717 RepID=A0A1F5G151_9BACT|nr:MAG: hypothetical protein A2696_03365 [Candidatus Curtissbacteria bacterium RIFCSPHIGHO2_01_FULL_41_13]OGE04385.1 MAG: hypothetical protein A3B51_02230 [Candidatus Curtissbacteria bacterium RIFCSPLOWO2_01_FULL_41_18]
MKRSRLDRLARREEKSVVKRIVFLFLFSLILIGILYTVGIPTLGKFADVLDTIFKRGDSTSPSEVQTPPPPVLSDLPKSTNQDKIAISGFSSGSSKVEVYLDSEKVADAQVNDGRFEFKDFRLHDGENKISAKAINDTGRASEFSPEVKVALDTNEPTIEVTSPRDDQTFYGDNRIKVEGQTEKDDQVFANGFLANVDPSGNFDVTIPLSEGENKIEVKAVDVAGNTKTVSIKVNFRK